MSASLRVLTPGASPNVFLALEAGAPFAVGVEGAWPIVGAGVMPIHGLVYFDGKQLNLSSMSEEQPVLVDGRAIPGSWTPITKACQIAFGSVVLAYQPPRRGLGRENLSQIAIVAMGALVVMAAVFANARYRTQPAATLRPRAAVMARVTAPTAPVGVVVHPVKHPPKRLGKSAERVAADALHAGDRQKAAALYRELAAVQPENAAFVALARALQ